MSGLFRLGERVMQILHYLPTQNQLSLEPAIAQCVIDLLLEPFETRAQAIAFWQDYTSKIIVLAPYDDVQKSLNCLDDVTRHFVDCAVNSPEFTESLPKNYQLSLTITDDSGSGLYLIKPVNMHLSKDNKK